MIVGPGGRTLCDFWTARVKSIKNDIFGILTLRAINWYIYMSRIREGGVGWSPGVVLVRGGGGPVFFWATPAEFYSYHQPIDTLFGQFGLRVGSVDVPKSQRHTRLGAGRGVSQANEAAIYPKHTGLCQHEVVSGILKKWKQCGAVQASYGCRVGHARLGGRISFLPQNSATLQFQVLMSMQMDAYLKKEQIGTLFVRVGAPEGGFGGGGAGGSSPLPSFEKKFPASWSDAAFLQSILLTVYYLHKSLASKATVDIG